jgi:hypothetical protein
MNIKVGDLVRAGHDSGLVYGFDSPSVGMRGTLNLEVPADATCDVHWANGTQSWVRVGSLVFVSRVMWVWLAGTPTWPGVSVDLSKMNRKCEHPFPRRT